MTICPKITFDFILIKLMEKYASPKKGTSQATKKIRKSRANIKVQKIDLKFCAPKTQLRL